MRHLTRDELLEALEAQSDPNARRHAEGAAGWAAHIRECAACASELRDLSTLLEELSSVTVPEPSPLFWERFSERVSRATEQEDRSRRGGWRAWGRAFASARWARGLRWLVPAAAAVVVLLIVAGTWKSPEPAATRAAAPVAASGAAREAAALGADVLVDAPPAANDEPWQVLADLAAEAGEADAAGGQASPLSVGAPGDADNAILHLSDEERAELGRLLEAEIGSRGDRVEG